jgi:O-antigen/teichoic acid export membrane protein
MFTLKRLRKSRAALNAAASYLAVVSTAVSGLLSIPIAVRFLDKQELGLWALVNTIIGYLMWMDLGVGDATGRKIADAVANADQNEINRWWTASRCALFVQAMIVILLGFAFLPVFLHVFPIEAGMKRESAILYGGAVLITAANFPMRGAPGLLTAQQRFHWVPLLQSILPWIQLGTFALFLNVGWGLRAYLSSLAATVASSWVYYTILIRKSPLVPRWSREGLVKSRFQSLFSFSLKLNVVQLVEAIVSSLPALLLGRLAGLASVPVYTFTAKIPYLLIGIVRRTYHAFYPGILNLHVTGNTIMLQHRFRIVLHLVMAIGICCAGFVVSFNRSVISTLAGPDFDAGAMTTAWLALGLFLGPASGTFSALFTISGSLRKIPHFYAIKLVGVVAVSVPAYHMFGMAGLAASLTLWTLPSGIYGYLHGAKLCGIQASSLIPRPFWQIVLPTVLILGAGAWFARADLSDPVLIYGQRTIHLPAWQEWLVATLSCSIGLFWLLKVWRNLKTPPVTSAT